MKIGEEKVNEGELTVLGSGVKVKEDTFIHGGEIVDSNMYIKYLEKPMAKGFAITRKTDGAIHANFLERGVVE